ncbi:S41 family peptidase [Leucothrix arctica]|uniref:Tail specific protease domain-containing protein n=1 Tax=Leucothrix arctica TaxID=1481894 RepID=A0A317C4A8_9GAMM|nr:S41 family peptidase [Leucothrix arctica]PWQ93418.1 hypothetical protein DKT75_17465 [Leucothrix arctica]
MIFQNYLSLTSTLTLTVLLTACNSSLKAEFDEKTDYEKAHGIWEKQGYGDIYQLTDVNAKVYEYNSHSCMLSDVLTIEEAEEAIIDSFEISQGGRSAVITTAQAGVFPVNLQLRDALPETCEEDKLLETSDPEIAFEHLWHTFNDYYAFFEIREVDWQTQYQTYRPLVSSDTTDEQLFTLISAMLAPLQDGHIGLTAGDEDFSPEPDSQLEIDLYKAFTQQNDVDNFSQFAYSMLDQINDITLSNVSNLKHAGGEDEDTISWGTLSGNLGYLNIASMINVVTDGDIEDSHKEAEAANTILSQAFEDLKDTDGIVIDVRLNSGGHDAVGLAIASHFFS